MRVDFYNRIRRGQVKVCKHITPGSADSLGGKTFNFEIRTTHPAFPGQLPVGPLAPEECALLTVGGAVANIPVLTPAGNQTIIGARELGTDEVPPPSFGMYFVSALSLQGGRGPLAHNCQPEASSPTGQHCFLITTPIGTPPDLTIPGVHGARTLGTRAEHEHDPLHQLGG